MILDLDLWKSNFCGSQSCSDTFCLRFVFDLIIFQNAFYWDFYEILLWKIQFFLLRFIVPISSQHHWNIIKLYTTKSISTRHLNALQPLCAVLLFFPIFYGAPESMAVFYTHLWGYNLKTQYQKPLLQYCHPLLCLRGIFPNHQSGQY